MRIFRHLISWALALFLIAMFIQSTIAPLPNPPEGSVKLFDAPGQNIVFQTIAERSGVSLFEPAGRFVIATVELLAAFSCCCRFRGGSERRLRHWFAAPPLRFTCLPGLAGKYQSHWIRRALRRMEDSCSCCRS